MLNKNIPYYLQSEFYKSTFYMKLNDIEKKVAKDLKLNGFSKINNFINLKLINKIINDCNGKYVYSKKHKNEERRVQDAFTFADSVKNLAVDKNICNLLSNIYGRRSVPFQTLNFEIGTEQPTHSDTIHFNSLPNYFLTGVWVAFENVNKSNGPLHYIKDSHHIPSLDYSDLLIDDSVKSKDKYNYYHQYEAKIKDLIKGLKLKTKVIHMKKGDVFIWSANLLHGGSKIILKNSTRLSQVTHYYYDDCVYYTPMHSNIFKQKYSLRRPYNIFNNKKLSWLNIIKNLYNNDFTTLKILKSIIHTKLIK
ncbi:phytanoyl-CoA dioxygenase family protein [Alphaproteobacteria bacterium]|nr:phytanoyl-CoA dioxygenase family protein [Alphaproteobacteria bacterium]